jgi:predicted MFS family arabinose efflux permease
VLGLAMRLMLYEAAFATLAAAGGSEARRALSVLMLYGGLASTVFWPLGAALIAAFGWRATFGIYAAFNLFICLPLHAFFMPKASVPTARAEAAEATAKSGIYLRGRERTLAVVALTLAFVLLMYVNSALSAHVVDILIAFGLSYDHAVFASSLKGIGQVAGRLWEILFAGALHPLTLTMIAIGLTPLALAALLLPFGLAAGFAFAFGQGASNGLITIARGVVPLVLFGPAGYGALIGAMSAPVLLAVAIAPALYAVIVGAWGHEAAMLSNIAAATTGFAIVAGLAWRMRRG